MFKQIITAWCVSETHDFFSKIKNIFSSVAMFFIHFFVGNKKKKENESQYSIHLDTKQSIYKQDSWTPAPKRVTIL